jgi:hypothetical protein
MIRQLSMSFLVCDNVNQIEFNDTEIRHLIQAKYWLKKGHSKHYTQNITEMPEHHFIPKSQKTEAK